MSIAKWQNEIKQWSIDKGWYDPNRDVNSAYLLFNTEIAEMTEEFRGGHEPNEIYYAEEKPNKPEGVPIEWADTVIRVLDYAGCHDLDLESKMIVEAKIYPNRPESLGEWLEPATRKAIGGKYPWRHETMSFPEHGMALVHRIALAWIQRNLFAPEIQLGLLILALLDFANCWDIDPDEAMQLKHAYNLGRPFRHGDKRI